MIDGMIARIKREMLGSDDGELVVIGTGGMASVIAPAAKSIAHVDQLLTLKGLKHIHDSKVGA